MKLIIDIDEDTYKDIKKGKVYSSVRDVPQESVLAIANGTPIPDNATNGDMFRVFFPNGIEMQDLKNTTERWWNAPYQKGGK